MLWLWQVVVEVTSDVHGQEQRVLVFVHCEVFVVVIRLLLLLGLLRIVGLLLLRFLGIFGFLFFGLFGVMGLLLLGLFGIMR